MQLIVLVFFRLMRQQHEQQQVIRVMTTIWSWSGHWKSIHWKERAIRQFRKLADDMTGLTIRTIGQGFCNEV